MGGITPISINKVIRNCKLLINGRLIFIIFYNEYNVMYINKFMIKILLVEDNEMNRDMLSRRLQRKGYEVVMAVNGVEGVNMTRTEQPDLVLMDMSLPEMDGWEATKELKGDIKTQSIPIIALTAHAMSSDREKALEAGCDDYDTKPVEFTRLLTKIDTLLKKRSS